MSMMISTTERKHHGETRSGIRKSVARAASCFDRLEPPELPFGEPRSSDGVMTFVSTPKFYYAAHRMVNNLSSSTFSLKLFNDKVHGFPRPLA
jgi:hypothetical protein